MKQKKPPRGGHHTKKRIARNYAEKAAATAGSDEAIMEVII